MATDGIPRARGLTYAGIFAVALATLMLEIVLTRITSVAAWYDLAFFVISLAMLGMTAGAVVVFLLPDWFTQAQIPKRLAQSPSHSTHPRQPRTSTCLLPSARRPPSSSCRKMVGEMDSKEQRRHYVVNRLTSGKGLGVDLDWTDTRGEPGSTQVSVLCRPPGYLVLLETFYDKDAYAEANYIADERHEFDTIEAVESFLSAHGIRLDKLHK